MAYVNLATKVNFGSEPEMRLSFDYDSRRNGNAMEYRIKITIDKLNTTSSMFGYPVYANIDTDGVRRLTKVVAKDYSPSQWTSPIVYETAWFSAGDKLSGTTSLKINCYSQGTYRDYTYNYNMAVLPAVSTISTASSGTLNTAQTITVTRYSTAYTHTLTATCGSDSQTIVTSSSTTSISWTPKLAFASQAPNATSVTAKVTCVTLDSSGTKVGESSATVTLAIPSSVVPSVSFTVTDGKGYKNTYGQFLQNLSTASISASGSGAYGSTIKSYKIAVSSWSYQSASATTPVLNMSGTLPITVTVTDTRNRTASSTQNITIASYATPKITAISTYRCNASGSADANGAYMRCVFSAQVTSLSGLSKTNVAYYKFQYRQSGASTWTESALTSYNNNFAPSNASVIQAADVGKAWQILISIQDAFGTITSAIYNIPTAFIPMQFTSDGKGVAFGKSAELTENFDVGETAIFRERVQEQKGSWVHSTTGVTATSGWAHVATISITGVYTNQPFTFTVLQRGKEPYTITIRFAAENNTDPQLHVFQCDSNGTMPKLRKASAGVWELLIEKSEAFDRIDITNMAFGEYSRMQGVAITWENKMASTTDGAVDATALHIANYQYEALLSRETSFANDTWVEFACNWEDYVFLSVVPCMYSNHYAGVFLPTSVARTLNNSNARIIIDEPCSLQMYFQSGKVVVRKSNDGSVICGFYLYGICHK